MKHKILYQSHWGRSLTIKTTSNSDVYGIIMLGFANFNDYYMFQSHGDYLKYIKLAGASSDLTISKNNQSGNITIQYGGAGNIDFNLIVFSVTTIQTIDVIKG